MKTNAYTATHDELTGLPNEFLLFDRLNQVIAASERGTNRFALLAIVMNNYSAVYKEHGQVICDRLILKIAETLHTILREPDTITRREDNTFVILLPQIDSELTLPQLVLRVEKALKQAFLIGSNRISLNISVGQAIYPYNGTDAIQLFKHALSESKQPA